MLVKLNVIKLYFHRRSNNNIVISNKTPAILPVEESDHLHGDLEASSTKPVYDNQSEIILSPRRPSDALTNSLIGPRKLNFNEMSDIFMEDASQENFKSDVIDEQEGIVQENLLVLPVDEKVLKIQKGL